MKFLLDVLQVAIVIKLIWIAGKWLLIRGRKKKRRSIASKIYKLTTNKIHYKLNCALAKQREALRSDKISKVVPIRKTK